MKYHKTFKIIRAATGLSQQNFAKKIGIDPSLISRIELGNREPTQRTIRAISKKLSISPNLMKLLSKEKSEIVFDGVEVNKIGLELLKVFFQFDNNNQSFSSRKLGKNTINK